MPCNVLHQILHMRYYKFGRGSKELLFFFVATLHKVHGSRFDEMCRGVCGDHGEKRVCRRGVGIVAMSFRLGGMCGLVGAGVGYLVVDCFVDFVDFADFVDLLSDAPVLHEGVE